MDTHESTAPSEERLIAALECLLFMADRPLPAEELGEMLGLAPERAAELADGLMAAYAGRGLQITRVAGGYQMCTRSEFGEVVAKLHEPHRFRLSRAALETLAIIAYQQPVTRPEMEALRGVSCDSVVDTLLERGLIRERGRRHTPGRPMSYGTTPEFLAQFGLNSLQDLPELPKVSAEEVQARLRVEAAQAAAAAGAAGQGVEPSGDAGAADDASQAAQPAPENPPAT